MLFPSYCIQVRALNKPADMGPEHLAEAVCARVPTVRQLFSACPCCALQKKSLCTSHTEQEGGFPPLGWRGYRDDTDQFCGGDMSLRLCLPTYSISHFYHYDSLYTELLPNTALFDCSVFQLWPLEIFPWTPGPFCHNPTIVLLLLFERFLTSWHYNT